MQIFSNVVTNALDAMRRGGVLSVSIREVAGSAGDGIQTEIRDSGMGIQPEHLTRIFEPFFTSMGDVGTGIGLWVTKRLVKPAEGKSPSLVASIMEATVRP